MSVVEPEVDPEKHARVLESKRKYRERVKAAKTAPDLAALGQSALLVTIVSATATTIAGPDAAMLPHERELILDPLNRIIARMPEETRAALDKYADPLALMFGLSVWGLRVYQVARAKAESASPVQEGAPYPVGYTDPIESPAESPVESKSETTAIVSQSPALARDLARLVDSGE